MHGNKTFNCFDLHDDGTGHYQVKAITTIELEPFVSDWQRHLRFKRQLSQSEFITEALGICRFQQFQPTRLTAETRRRRGKRGGSLVTVSSKNCASCSGARFSGSLSQLIELLDTGLSGGENGEAAGDE